MRRWSLALLVSLATPALAQAPAAPTTPESPAAQAPAAEAPAAPAPAAPAPAAPARARAPAARAPAAAPAPAAPAPVAPSPDSRDAVPVASAPEVPAAEQKRRDIQSDARFLFQSLLTGDVRSAANELFYPFQLEDRRYTTPEELVVAWVKQLRLKRTDLITLYDIEVIPLEELEKRHGKSPVRLGMDLRGQKDLWAAIGNLSGHAAIFLFRPYGDDEYRAFAYTD